MPIGPSTTKAPYLLEEPNVRITSLLTVGDQVGFKTDGVTPWYMVGIPDGLGAYDNGDGTITVLMNHELGATVGVVREHGAIGAFVSELTIDKATLAVTAAKDAITDVQLWDDGTDSYVSSTYAIGRLCSADLAAPSAYYYVDDNGTPGDLGDDITYGTLDRIFMTGEENGAEGKQFGLVVTGTEAGIAYELPNLGLFSWENSVSSPHAQRATVNISTDDSAGGQVYVYLGEKQTTGSAIEKAGLTDGDLYGIDVTSIVNESNGAIASGAFSLVKLGVDEDLDGNPDGDVSEMTGAQLEAQSVALGVTGFLRPEDISWDPNNAEICYFVTTNAVGQPSRLYKLTFADIASPELGGTIEAVLDGTEGQQMLDNITVTAAGKVILQEDVGSNALIGKVWEYDIATDTLKTLVQHDPALYTPGSPTLKTIDEESSGVIDVTSMFGDADTAAYLLDIQSHNAIANPELVQDGQLLLMTVDTPVTQGTKNADNLFGSYANESFNGLAGNDTILGGSGIDNILGGMGLDFMNGGAGNDVIKGGDGKDTLIGGTGIDYLYGGNGADIFDYNAANESNVAADIIYDFRSGQGDKIDLAGIDADTVNAGDQSFSVVAAFSNVAGQLVLTHTGGGQFDVRGDVNGDSIADLFIHVKTPALVAADFIL